MTAGKPNHEPKGINSKDAAIPLEVVILTPDHEVQGIIYVSRSAKSDRRISELLNEPDKRFLAVTDAKLINRVGPSAPRLYSFLQLHIDNIVMIHPATQIVMRNTDYSKDEALRFDSLRTKVNQGSSGHAESLG
jgi:hypothetical protein